MRLLAGNLAPDQCGADPDGAGEAAAVLPIADTLPELPGEPDITAVILPEFDAMMDTEQHNPHHCFTRGRAYAESADLRTG